MNVLITGGLGYIGSHFVYKLANNPRYTITIIDNLSNSNIDTFNKLLYRLDPGINFINLDIRNDLSDVFNNKYYDFVFHFAALKSVSDSENNKFEYNDVNVNGTKNLLSYIRGTNSILIFSSTAAIYDTQNINSLISENDLINPISEYGKTKFKAENIIMESGSNFIILRYFNPIGFFNNFLLKQFLNSNDDSLMKNIFHSISNKSLFKVYGNNYDTEDGSCIRDFISINDLVCAHINILDKNLLKKNSHLLNKSYNIGTGVGMSIFQIVNLLMQNSYIDFKFEISKPRVGDVAYSVANPELFKNSFKWNNKENTINAWINLLKLSMDRRTT
jgi:UDP-glucose 4-epimerase